MPKREPPIGPLRDTEPLFLEVLLPRLDLKRLSSGAVRLTIEFDEGSPSIWNRAGVRYVRGSIPRFDERAERLQTRLDAFLLDGNGRREAIEERGFPFRYASGGTLPVVRIGGTDFYCLFYRDIHPVGWNIANGGCLSRGELMSPLEAAERELREELIILDLANRRRYVFAGEGGKPADWPDFSEARRLWSERLGVAVHEFLERPTPLKWIDGQDEVSLRSGKHERVLVKGCFLNINALDFGIEIDRIAKLRVDEEAVLLDGEIFHNDPINQIVGLFDVRRLNDSLDSDEFLPDLCFYGARRIHPARFQSTLDEYLRQRWRRKESAASRQEFTRSRKKFDLCPVTRRIIARYIGLSGGYEPPEKNAYEVFVSFPGEDERFAKHVYQWCVQQGYSTFFSEKTRHQSNFHSEIDDALDSARHLIVVSSSAERMWKEWVKYEWERFHCDILNGRKKDAHMLSYISGFLAQDLPGPLRPRESVQFQLARPKASLPKLARYLPPQ